jgi:hypothetical protein
MKNSVSGTGASDEMKEIGELASEAGDRIAADAKEDETPDKVDKEADKS